VKENDPTTWEIFLPGRFKREGARHIVTRLIVFIFA
jgi:hypothetical protein